MAEFEGMPLVRSEPESEQSTFDVLKNTKFTNQRQLFDFYEKNRNQFNDIDMFATILTKLASTQRGEAKENQMKGDNSQTVALHVS